MNLNELRSELSAVDRQLIELIAERQRLVGDIGRSKQSSGAGTRDYAREKDVLDMARGQAEELGLDPELAENVLRQLIRSSLASQERDRVISEGKGDGRSVLVIGGAGQMGRWFVDFFASQGFAVVIADKGVDDGKGTFSNWTDAGVDYDVIVVAAPLGVSGRILAQLAVSETQRIDLRYRFAQDAATGWIGGTAECGLPDYILTPDVWAEYAVAVRASPHFCGSRVP